MRRKRLAQVRNDPEDVVFRAQQLRLRLVLSIAYGRYC